MAVVSGSASKRTQLEQPQQHKSQTTNSSSKDQLKPNSPLKKSPKKRNNCPGIRVIGGRIYDSKDGKTCHQCRQKTRDFNAACMNQREGKPCPVRFCHKCLLNRYGEQAEVVAQSGVWNCPKCRGICNCSVCMKRKGFQPTGNLVSTAKASGFSSVQQMLQVNIDGSLGLATAAQNTGSLLSETVATEQEISTNLGSKQDKENLFDGKIDQNLQAKVSSPAGAQKNSKKLAVEEVNQRRDESPVGVVQARVTRHSGKKAVVLKEASDVNMVAAELEKGKVAMKPQNVADLSNCKTGDKKQNNIKRQACNEKHDKEMELKTNTLIEERKLKKPKQDGFQNKEEPGDVVEAASGKSETSDVVLSKAVKAKIGAKAEKRKYKKCLPKDCSIVLGAGIGNIDVVEAVPSKAETSDIVSSKEVKTEIGSKAEKRKYKRSLLKDCSIALGAGTENISKPHVPLPQGIELMNVCGIELPSEDVGNVLQFLEFCSVFGKAIAVKKGQAESVVRDIVQGRTGRRGKYSLTVQFLIQVLSVIQEDEDGSSSLSPTHGRSSWINSLKQCISDSHDVAKLMDLDLLDEGADIYESLSSSRKLKLLNFLCDEILGTSKLRDWIEEQNAKLAEKTKEKNLEVKSKVHAAKEKEKQLKQKMQDNIAQAVLANNGTSLSIAEYEAIISDIKLKTAEAHAEVLESKGMLLKGNQISDSVRIEPILLDASDNGHAYWRLRCCSDKSDILLQDLGNGDSTLALKEKWFTFDDEQKGAIEKHITVHGKKRLRA